MAPSPQPARSALTITTPSDSAIVYDMAVQLSPDELFLRAAVTLEPWVRIKADQDNTIELAAGIRVRRA